MGIKLRTEWSIEPGDSRMDHHSRPLLIGSCFSEHIAHKLRFSGFELCENPHGILFHPLAIEQAISDCLLCRTYRTEDLIFNGDVWTSPNHHGRFNHSHAEVVLDSINSEILRAHSYLKTATHLVLTLGTSWAYRHRKRDAYVANCHKIPQGEFSKELLKTEEILKSLESIISQIRRVNPSTVVILTVSPVRHVKDGIVENSRSKARLHEAVHQSIEALENVSYFPSFELMMDDLRDYRFYKRDLIHPNETAVEYIWQKFSETWISLSCYPLMKEAQSIHKALEHQPIGSDPEKHRAFLDSVERRIQELQKKHPELRIHR